MNGQEPCVYCTKSNWVVDFVRPQETAATALSRLQPNYGNSLVVLAIDDAIARQEQAFTTKPAEITADTFQEMLCVLPPVDWRTTGCGESFKISERLIASITSIYVRLGDRHFTFQDKITLPHEDCCARVRASKAYLEPAPTLAPDRN